MSTNTSSIRFSEVAPSIKISPSRRRDDKSEQPSNKHRKNIFDKEVASHKVLDAADLKRVNESDDDDMDDSDTRVTIRDRQFEFSDGRGIMRLIRMLIIVQVIGILIDSSSITLSAVFKISCRGLLFYSIRFYSRPFLDIIYILQYFFATIAAFFNNQRQNTSSQSTSYEISDRRHLSNNTFLPTIRPTSAFEFITVKQYAKAPHARPFFIDFLNPSNWHSIKHWTHYFLGPLFVVLTACLTFYLWEISDYSNRGEVRIWLSRFVSDGWWRRGGWGIARFTLICYLLLAFFVWLLFATAMEFNKSWVPPADVLGTVFLLGLSVTFVTWLLGYMGIRMTEAAFLRYVSQNVSYTSQIILKRAVKSKIELGILLMTLMYMPVLYTLTKSVIVITDWNVLTAESFRKDYNYYVPCYFMGFPPYRNQKFSPSSCPMASYSSSSQPPREAGFYRDSSILQCDSYLGIVIFVVSAVLMALLITGYFYVFHTTIHLVAIEFKESKFVETLGRLMAYRDREVTDYQMRFSFLSRFCIAFGTEVTLQARYQFESIAWLFESIKFLFISAIQILVSPIVMVSQPIWYLGKTVVTITWLNTFTADGKARKQQLELLRRAKQTSVEVTPVEIENENKSVSLGSRVYNALNIYRHSINAAKSVSQAYHRTNFAVCLRMSFQSCKNIFIEDASMMGLARLGGSSAPWRMDQSLSAKSNVLAKMHHYVDVELRKAMKNFIAEHELFYCSFFDRCVDSAGISMLILPFRYYHSLWFLVVLTELSLYAIMGAILNQYAPWTTRNLTFLFINCLFGLITYVSHPYVDIFDRWLEYSGRLLISIVSVGLIITAAIEPAKIKYSQTALYNAGGTASYFVGQKGLFNGFGIYDVLDLCMALAFYTYIVYVLFRVGCFHVFQRMIRNALYVYHDHVFDFLVDYVDQKTIGMDNIFSGFRLIQQWDDIIKIQRRYAFLTWPDVRPPHLVSTFVKLLEIKWASLFNLTVNNMRSSLGLTLLHTAMFSANSEAAKWLLYSNPDLVTVQDSQNDTPVTIALKECAYFLLAYGQQNNGQLDDGTSYSDDKFNDYYPEVEDIRDSIYQRGEFLEDRYTVTSLTAQDLIILKDEGYYVEPPPAKEVEDDEAFLKAKMLTTNSKKQKEQLALELERRAEIQRKKRNAIRRLEAAAAAEKKAMHSHRFPEDHANDNLEAGQLSSWLVLGLTVPAVNIFLDQRIVGLLKKDSKYSYTKPLPGEAADLQYVVPSSRPVREVDVQDFLVPLNHAALKDMPDFNKRRRRREFAREKATRESDLFSATSGGAQSSVNSDDTSRAGGQSSSFLKLSPFGSQHRRTEVADREARWNICKFAEILLSDEISSRFKAIEWSMTDYKEFNKMASAAQGRIVQNLAYCCHLNPPEGFTRISDWHRGSLPAVFDDPPELYVSSVVKGVATAVEVIDKAASVAGRMVGTVLNGADDISSMVRGRARRRSRRKSLTESRSGSGEGGASSSSSILSDRIVQFLAEAFVCSTERVSLEDCELSYDARIGWRAIVRALRKKNCSFISPSMFVSPRPILIRYLNLPKNELDCGDAVYLADIFVNQPLLVSIDLTFNRFGARGCARMMRALRESKNLVTLRLDHNIIGPAAGKDISSFLKNSQLKVLSISYNSLGEIARFPTLYTREKIPSSVHDIFLGVRLNTSLQLLDVSYNHLGPGCAIAVPPAVLRHPNLVVLNLSGNSIGNKAGSQLIFSLAGFPQGIKFAQDMQHFITTVRSRQLQGAKISEDDVRSGLATVIKESEGGIEPSTTSAPASGGVVGKRSGSFSPGPKHASSGSPKPSPSSPSPNANPQRADDCADTTRPAPLVSLSLADNRLGPFCGYALASLLERNNALTDLDVSGNALGFGGGEAVSDQLELCYGMKPREFVKRCLYDMEQKRYEGRNPKKKKKVFTNLMNLNMSRNGLGPTVTGTIALCLGQGGCTLTSLDLSDNPLGYSAKNGGFARDAGLDLKLGLRTSSTLAFLNLSQSTLQPSEMIPMFSGLALNVSLLTLQLRSLRFDEPSCLQLCTVLAKVSTLTSLDLCDCSMGSNGAFLIACKVRVLTDRLKFLDLTGISMGPVSAIHIGEAIADPDSVVQTLRIARNDIMEEGGLYVCKGLMGNTSLTELDLGYNHLGAQSATHLADAIRGYYEKGVKISDCQLKRISVSGNAEIGPKSARLLVRALANHRLTHLEMADVGASAGLAKMLSMAMRDPALGWQVCDLSGNKFGRMGCNQIFWALRQNKRLRVLKLGHNQQGTVFCSNDDALLKHGIAATKLLSINVVIRELDLSFSSITTDGGLNLLDAIIENHSLKTLSLRGNLLDDNLALMLSELLRCNNVLEDLDLGRNRLGFSCCYAIAEGLETNRSLKTLRVDNNRFGGAGTATLDSFCRSMMLNCNLKALLLDGNRLGPEWGVRLAEAIARNGSLIQLSLRDNRLDLRAGQALLRAFKKAEYLVELALSADEVGEALWEDFRREFASKRSSIHPDSLIQETKLTAKQLHLIDSYGF